MRSLFLLTLSVLLLVLQTCAAYISFRADARGNFYPGLRAISQRDFILDIDGNDNRVIQLFTRSNSFASDAVSVILSSNVAGVLSQPSIPFTFTKQSNQFTPFTVDLSKVQSTAVIYASVTDADTRMQSIRINRSGAVPNPVPAPAPVPVPPPVPVPIPAPVPAPQPAPVPVPVPVPPPVPVPVPPPKPAPVPVPPPVPVPVPTPNPAPVPVPPPVPVPSPTPTSGAVYTNLPTGSTYDMHAIVGILDWGNFVNPTKDVEEAKTWLFNSSNSVANNLQNAYHQCSYGQISFNPDNVFVYRLKLDSMAGNVLPFSDVRLTYNADENCGLGVLYAAQYAIRNYALKTFADDPIIKRISAQSRYHTIVIMPDMPKCMMYGVGNQNCQDQTCFANIVHRYGQFFSISAFHELGHNLGMNHAATSEWEYGDCNDPMGCASAVSGLTCPNAVNSYRMGWSDPIATLGAQAFASTNSLVFNLPAMRLSSTNHLIINAAGTQYFISYRSLSKNVFGYDSELDAGANQVYIHKYAGGRDLTSYELGYTQGALKVGDKWSVADTNGKTYTVQLNTIAPDQSFASVLVTYA